MPPLPSIRALAYVGENPSWGGLPMAGKIRTRQVRCKKCGARGEGWYHPESFTCLSCGWPVVLFEIVIHWRGKRLIVAHDDQGKRLRSREHAAQVNTILEAQIRQGKFYPEDWRSKRSARYLWENYAQEYLEREALKVEYSALRNKRCAVRHMAWFDGLNVKDIRLGHVEDYTAWLRRKSGLASSTQNRVLAILRHILNSAYRRGEIGRAVHITIEAAPKREIPYLTEDQQALVLDHIPEQHRPIFQFLMQYGVRVGEACGLCWDCVDFQRGVFWLKRTFSQSKLHETTKNRQERSLPLMDWFEWWLGQVPRGIGATPVFINPGAYGRRKNYTDCFLGRVWRAALKDAGLPAMPLKNGTRHSLGFRLASWGRSMEQIRDVLGHTDSKTTESYVRLGASHLRKLMEE